LSCNFTELHSHAATPDATDLGDIFGEKAYYENLAKVQSKARTVSDELFMQVNVQDILGWTPLHYVAARKEMEAEAWIDEFVRKQADVNAVDIRHRTALHYAILNCNVRSFKALLKAGADITTTGVDGMTPLHCVALTNSEYMAKSLLSHSRQAVDQFARDNYGRVPVHLAALGGNISIIKHFQGSIEAKDLQDRTALHLATLSGHPKAITELARYKASPNALYRQFRGGGETTALIWAATEGNTEVVQRLIEAGADVNGRDYALWTSLHEASKHGHADIADVLIVKGALINSTERCRQTPLHLAASAGRLEVVRRLVQETGIKLNIREWDMKLAVQVAAENGYFEVVELLARKGAIIDNKTTLLVAGGVKKKATEELTQHVDREDEETGAASCKKSYRKAFDQQGLSLWQAWQSYSEEDGGDIIWEGLIRRLLLSYRE
jgi:cytohesin